MPHHTRDNSLPKVIALTSEVSTTGTRRRVLLRSHPPPLHMSSRMLGHLSSPAGATRRHRPARQRSLSRSPSRARRPARSPSRARRPTRSPSTRRVATATAHQMHPSSIAASMFWWCVNTRCGRANLRYPIKRFCGYCGQEQ